MRNLAGYLGLLGATLFIAGVILAGALLPGYDHVSDLISESYAQGTPYGTVLRYGLFLPSGICLALFGLMASRVLPTGRLALIMLGLAYGAGTAVVALFPCDAGCDPVDPSTSQVIHMGTGALTYLISPVALLAISRAARSWKEGAFLSKAALACGLVAGAGVVFLFGAPEAECIGLVQRCIEGAILLWIILCSRQLLRSRSLHHQSALGA